MINVERIAKHGVRLSPSIHQNGDVSCQGTVHIALAVNNRNRRSAIVPPFNWRSEPLLLKIALRLELS
jgi:hypothetical protein